MYVKSRFQKPWIFGLLFVVAVQAQTFSLEAILGAPFPSDLVAAPRGGKVAWIFNDRGIRNIWVAQPPEYRGQAITSYTHDDGQPLSSLTWSPDGKYIVYVRGGSTARSSEHPNPLSKPQATEQAVWVVPASGSKPKKLGTGSSPAISPSGDRVAFLFEGDIWWAPLRGRGKAVKLIHNRGSSGSLRWSPDGSKLAFTVSRGSHRYVAIYDLDGAAVRFLAPSVDSDMSPVWSPDGRKVAFIRLPAYRQQLPFGPQRAGYPWSIWVADAETAQGQMIWQADEGPGSVFRGISAENQLFWTTNNLLVFPWEKDGWTHLYTVPVTGGEVVLLTPGEFEVEHVSLNPDGRSLVYSSNQEDIDRRHIWRVPVDGGPSETVTTGEGIEWSPSTTSDSRAVAFLASDARRPAHPAIIVGNVGSPQELAPGTIPSTFPEDQLVTPRQVIFKAEDGITIHGQLFLPRDQEPGARYPAVIFLHGGSRRQMLLGWHYMGYYHRCYSLCQYQASQGYIVLSVNYRSGIGYGMDFREALNYGAQGASEYNDVVAAGRYLQNRPDVDPDRIGLWGGSYGGYLTALGLARNSDLFAAGVDLHGVHNWNTEIPLWDRSYNPLERPEFADVAFKSSPLADVETWRSPVLVIHGDDDRNVPFTETVDLVERLREQNVTVEQLIFPDEVHGFLLHDNWIEAFGSTIDFFDNYLQRSAQP